MSNRRNRDPFEPERRRRRSRRNEVEDARADRPAEPRHRSRQSEPSRPRRWPWILLVLLLIIGLLPNIVGWLGLHNQVLPWALGDFQGKVNVRKVSMGWFQSIHMEGVEATDLAGNPLVTIDTLKTSKPLYSFINAKDYGEVDIYRPVFYYHVRADGSNFEDAISRYIANAQPSPLETKQPAATSPMVLPQMLVRVHDGAAKIQADGIQRIWQIDALTAEALVSGPEVPLATRAKFQAMSLMPDASGQLAVAETGAVLLNADVDAGANELTFSNAKFELESEQFPLSIIAPLSQRFIGPAQIGGSASSKITAAWNASTNEVAANIDSLLLAHPQIYAPGLLNEDHFYVEQLTARGAMQLSPSRIFADQFIVETDFGKLDANGQFDPGQLAKLSDGSQLPDSDLQMQGQIDIATLMQRLPSTFQLHEDLKFESGTIGFTAGQRNDTDARRLVVNVDTANVRATRGGQPIIWQQPLRLVGVLRESAGQFSIESLQCTSDFLNINGSATLRQGMFKVDGNLGELSNRIRQFADLGPVQFAGALDGQFGWQVVGENEVDIAGLINQPIQMGGEFTVDHPVIEMADMPRWSPNQLVIRTSGSGQLAGDETKSVLQLGQAGAQLIVGSETGVVSLARPVADAFTNQEWVFNTQVTGELAGWLQHVRNFVDPGEFEVGGTVNFAGITIVDPNQVRIENGQYEIKQLGFNGYGANVREDRVTGAVTAGYALASGDVAIQQATIQGSGLSASAQNMNLTYGSTAQFEQAMQLEGSAAWRADINRAAEWFSLSPEADSVNWFGAASGTIDFKNSAQGTDATFRADMSDLVATQRATAGGTNQTMQLASNRQAWTELWRESNVSCNGTVSIGSDFDALQLHQFTARSGSLDFDAKGTASDLAGTMNLNLDGTWQPNFDRINSLLAAYSQDFVTLSGTSVQPFRISGPLFENSSSGAWVPDQLNVQTVVGWDSGQVAGLPIGRADIGVDLQQQIARAQTQGTGIPVSGGSIQVQPQLDMRSGDPVLIHGQSKILDRVQVTPEICRDCLKFVAPWLSDTTSAEGVFSADLQGLNMPLFDPAKVSARGTLVMENVNVAAGPIAEQLLGTVQQLQAVLKPDSRQREVKTWLTVEQQAIPLAVENGRVYHEGIKFSHNEIVIRTSGSVGFDNSINMVAKIPIADEWLEGNQYLSGLRGQSISIPVSGTVNRPVIDQNAVKQLSADLVRNAAQGAIRNSITEKINPKLNEYQSQFSDKLTGEANKLQGKVGGFLQDKLGLPGGAQNATPTQTSPGASPVQNLEDKLNGELQKGFNKLFGG